MAIVKLINYSSYSTRTLREVTTWSHRAAWRYLGTRPQRKEIIFENSSSGMYSTRPKSPNPEAILTDILTRTVRMPPESARIDALCLSVFSVFAVGEPLSRDSAPLAPGVVVFSLVLQIMRREIEFLSKKHGGMYIFTKPKNGATLKSTKKLKSVERAIQNMPLNPSYSDNARLDVIEKRLAEMTDTLVSILGALNAQVRVTWNPPDPPDNPREPARRLIEL